jgi:hypothetical protein
MPKMHDNVQDSWKRLIDPDVLRPNLVIASLYMTAFELLKNTIVDRIKSFYSHGFDQSGYKLGPEYQSEVLARNRSPVYASLEWLKESMVVNENDIAAFEKIQSLRNDLVHGIPHFVVNGLPSELAVLFPQMVFLLQKIERWWIVNVDMGNKPHFDEEKVDEESILPGPNIILRLMVDVALGSSEESRKYLR